MNLLITYQNELLGLLGIFLVIVLYFIVKQKRSVAKEQEKDIEAKLADKHSSIPVKQEKEEIEEEFYLDGTEEGNFIDDNEFDKEINDNEPDKENIKKEEEKEDKTITSRNISFVKRDVPPHEKIHKESFKEFAGERILLAEDNIINQKVILGLLADSGIEIVIANDGVEVLEILEKDKNFTLILMDAHMPRMDGFEATKKIRNNPDYDHIVIIALSGDTAADDIRKMQEAGMSEHLEKPLNIDAFYEILYAYSKPIENKKDTSSSDLQELNVQEGLEVSGNDPEFYNEILQEFLISYKDSFEEIQSYLKENKLKDADRLLLDLTGIAANIGAKNLQLTAQELKKVLYTDNGDYQKPLLNFKASLSKLINEITTYLD